MKRLLIFRKAPGAGVRPAPSAGRGGFFLLEAIVALGIFSIAILGLASAVGRILDAEKELRLLQRTRLELESHLAAAAAAKMQPGVSALESALPGVEFERKIEAEEPKNAEDQRLASLFKVTITARRKGAAGPEGELDSAWILIYQPQ